MTTTAVYDATFMRNLSIIAEDETLAKRLVKYVKKLAEPKADPTLMTKEEFFARVDEAREQIRRGECKRFTNHEQMSAWLNSL